MKHFNFLFVCLLVTIGSLNAQTNGAKFKVPKLYTQLGSFKDSASISVQEAENLIGQALKIYDDKKVAYSISSYQFMYRRKAMTENEETGKTSPTSSIVSSRFKVTPLPDVWTAQVKEQVQPGEELFFFDVIAKDAQGRVMYAPNLKIMVR